MHAAAALTLGALAAISGASGAVLEPRLAQPTPMAGAGVKRSIETTGSLQLPLYKRDVHAGPDGKRSPEQVLAHARAQRDYVLGKWSGAMLPKEERRKRHERRQLVGLTDVGPDSFYFAQVGMGTPQQNLGIILDTGSADMWVVAADCTSSQCDGVGKYNEGASSTFQNSSQPFSVTYGQGAAQGHMCADTVSLAGYTIDSMSFGIATTLGQGTLSPPSSGLQGLGFQQLSSAGVTPFWEVLAKQGKLQTNAFTFQLARNPNAQAQDQQSPGGVFTLGEIDSNQYTGNINYVNIPSSVQQYGFWAITLDSIAVNKGSPVKLSQIAAIDTGTTLIAVPLQVASAIYQAISGSQQVPQLGQGYYAFPCTANPSITLYFGGQGYTVGSTDFNSGAIDSQGKYCLGAIFGLDTGGSAPPVIAGDAFLKNVFSVYRADNPAVGFAQLKQNGVAQTASTTGSLVQATGAPAQSQGGLGSVTSDVPAQLTNVVQEPATGTSVYFASGVSSPVARGSTVNSNPSLGSGSSGGSTSSSGGSIIGGLFGGAAPAAGAATLLVSVVSAAAALALL